MSINVWIALILLWAGFVSYELWGTGGAVMIGSVWFFAVVCRIIFGD